MLWLVLSRDFLQLAIGGPLTGLAFGMATAFWLRYMYNVPTAEITLTILATYGTYVVGDELFKVSAVLAVVTLGALCHAPAIDSRCQESLVDSTLLVGLQSPSEVTFCSMRAPLNMQGQSDLGVMQGSTCLQRV